MLGCLLRMGWCSVTGSSTRCHTVVIITPGVHTCSKQLVRRCTPIGCFWFLGSCWFLVFLWSDVTVVVCCLHPLPLLLVVLLVA